MKLVKQIVQRNLYKYEEMKMNGKFFYHFNFYTAFAFSYFALIRLGKIKYNPSLLKEREKMFHIYYNKILNVAIKKSKTNKDIKKNYFTLITESGWKAKIDKIMREDQKVIEEFMKHYEELEVDDERDTKMFEKGILWVYDL